MRVTYHNGRANKKGAFLPQHNDRSGGLGEHIDTERSEQNYYWTWDNRASFAESERTFYEKAFAKSLSDRNDRYKQNRHSKRMQTLDQYRRNPRSCPEETIWQLGKLGDSVSAEVLWSIVCEVLDWQATKYPQCQVLNAALHVDEQGAPHIHVRQVWIAHNQWGQQIVGQNASLREMGVERPDPNRPEGRYNNAKMTFTSSVREHLQAIAREHGVNIEDVPRERSQSGLALTEYKARQEEAKARDAQETARKAQETARKAQEAAWEAEAEESKHRAGAEILRTMERTAEAVSKTESLPVIDVVKTITARKGIFGIGGRPEMAVVDAKELARVQTGTDLREGMQAAARELQSTTQQLKRAARDRHMSSHEIDLQRIEMAELREAQANRRAMEAENAAKAAEARAKAAEMATERERQRADKLSTELADARDLLQWSNPEILRAVRKYATQQRITSEIQCGLGLHRDTVTTEHERMEQAIDRIL